MSLLNRQKPEASKPFAGYTDFQDCVDQNSEKGDPKAYCAEIMRNVEGKASTADYSDFESCVDANSDREDPEGYCSGLARSGKAFEEQRTVMSGMVALYPDPVMAAQMAIIPSLELTTAGVTVTPPEELHITLVYFPSIEESEVDDLIQKVALALANCPPGPIVTRAEGNAQFLLTSEGLVPHVVLFDPTALSYLHDSLSAYCCDTVPVAQNHGFIPHMTLAYASPSADLELEPPSPQQRLFSEATLRIGDSIVHTFPIGMGGGAAPESAPLGMHYMALRGKVDLLSMSGDSSGVQRSASQLVPDGTMTIATVSEKAGRRVGAGWRERLNSAIDNLKEMLSWADYEDREKTTNSGFIVFKDMMGTERWLSFSSNGFLDREREIVSTKALEQAVSEADNTGKRGPLRLWHTRGTDIGDCDFQAVQGRFLIESGTFRDDEMSIRAKSYLRATDESLGVSIGFLYPEEQLSADGVYGAIGFIERSVAPHSEVANPWTKFEALKEDAMNPRKTEWLKTVLGEEKAAAVIATADSATKELEAHVAFKTGSGGDMKDAMASMKAAMSVMEAAMGGGTTKDADADEGDASTADNSAKTDVSTNSETKGTVAVAAVDEEKEAPDLVSTLKELIAPLAAAVVGLKADFGTLADRVMAVETTQTEKAQKEADATPRGRDVFRASAADNNVLDAAKAREMLGDNDPPASPVKAYIDDLLGMSRS